jgi:hypothetical protein
MIDFNDAPTQEQARRMRRRLLIGTFSMNEALALYAREGLLPAALMSGLASGVLCLDDYNRLNVNDLCTHMHTLLHKEATDGAH